MCTLPHNLGLRCKSHTDAVFRYYFDTLTGSCRRFQYSQCGGNANNFDTLEQCENFCLEAQCPQGKGLRVNSALATCSGTQALTKLNSLVYSSAIALSDITCPSHYSCVQSIFKNNYICCTNSGKFLFFCLFFFNKFLEHVCHDNLNLGTSCFRDYFTVLRFYYNYKHGQCEPFQYYGCNGNGNNFLTKQQCETACNPPVHNGFIFILLKKSLNICLNIKTFL